MERTAVISKDGKYRYALTRSWDSTKPRVAFLMFNPSTADAGMDDHTVRKCVGFAHRWGYGSLVIVNLFALRSSDPRAIAKADDPVGPDYAYHFRRAVTMCKLTVCAWGCSQHMKGYGDWVQTTLSRLPVTMEVMCLGVTADGTPRHPLMLPYSTPLGPYA